MDKGRVSVSEAAILVDADPDEEEAVIVTPFDRFALQGFRFGLSDLWATPWKPLRASRVLHRAAIPFA